jgi:hypothetical protein
MAARKKLKKPIYVTTVLEESQHEALRRLAYKHRKPMAEIFREALRRTLRESNRVSR